LRRLLHATANTYGGVEDYLLYPSITQTYRDLMLNVGYQLEAEDLFRGSKHEHELSALICLFCAGGRIAPKDSCGPPDGL
jgi:hypothetical protein